MKREPRCNSESGTIPSLQMRVLVIHMNCSNYSHYIVWQDLIANMC